MATIQGLHQLTLVLDDNTKKEVTLRPIDFVALERKFGQRPASELENLSFEELMYLCWNASKRTGVTDDFDKWLNTVATIDGLGGEDRWLLLRTNSRHKFGRRVKPNRSSGVTVTDVFSVTKFTPKTSGRK